MQGHSTKMMWGCGALIALAVVLVAAGVGGGVLLLRDPVHADDGRDGVDDDGRQGRRLPERRAVVRPG